MTRIVAGTARGRLLVVPRGGATRPTSDRVREALFGRLDARGVLHGASVLDLSAGSGALGLEAASRGAGRVVLVESDRAGPRNGPHAYWNSTLSLLSRGCSTEPPGSFWKRQPQQMPVTIRTPTTVHRPTHVARARTTPSGAADG